MVFERKPEVQSIKARMSCSRKKSILFSLVANNRMRSLIGQTIVLTGGKNRLTNQNGASPVRNDFYLCAC